MEKNWGRKNGGSLSLGWKSLGSNTETWSWIWFPKPKRGLGPERVLILNTDTFSIFFRLNTDTNTSVFENHTGYWILVFLFCTGQVSAVLSMLTFR